MPGTNYIAAAFGEALSAAASEKGGPEYVHFRSADLEALIYDNPEDRQPGPGGDFSNSLIMVSVKLSDVELPMDEMESITVRGKSLEIFDYAIAEGRIDFHCGDPAQFNTGN